MIRDTRKTDMEGMIGERQSEADRKEGLEAGTWHLEETASVSKGRKGKKAGRANRQAGQGVFGRQHSRGK